MEYPPIAFVYKLIPYTYELALFSPEDLVYFYGEIPLIPLL